MVADLESAVGIDIGGTGIKGARVSLATGELLSERIKIPTPAGGRPEDIAGVVRELAERLDVQPSERLGVCFPAVVRHGRTMSAANVSPEWIGFEAERFFEQKLGRGIQFINDADAAGLAEIKFGAAQGRAGLTILTTLGTGIGSALLFDGVLVPNSELGHLELNGIAAEKQAAYSAKQRENLSWADWAARLQHYYELLERLFSPELFLVGGGVSKHENEFLPLLNLATPIRTAQFRNNAGIIGAASLPG